MLSLHKQYNNINKNGKLFFLLGLVNALLIVFYILELWTPVQTKNYSFETDLYELYDQQEIPDTEFTNDVKVKVNVISVKTTITTIKPSGVSQTNPMFDNIEIVSDDVKINESVIESTEVGEKDAIMVEGVYFKDIEEIEIEEEVIEDVPFMVIEKVPVYPGCKGNNDELRKCLEKKIQEHVSTNFNANLSQDLGLETGKKRIFVMFVIDRAGKITNIQSRAPHKRLQKEAERVIKLLPKMKPGLQRGRAVGVKYSLPIVFNVR